MLQFIISKSITSVLKVSFKLTFIQLCEKCPVRETNQQSIHALSANSPPIEPPGLTTYLYDETYLEDSIGNSI